LVLESIDAWKPGHASPCEVESEMVMTNVDSPEVPVLIDEEVEHVDCVKGRGNENRVGDEAV